jgi:hypothetical protein
MSTESEKTTAPLVRLSSLRTDSALERAGDWIESPSIPGASFLVRSINYGPYAIARDLLLQRLRRKSGGKPIPQDILFPELGRLYVQHLLLGWKGFDTEYSAEVAMQTLTDPEFRDVVAAVEAAAGEVGQSEIEFLDQTSKNSETPSAGS